MASGRACRRARGASSSSCWSRLLSLSYTILTNNRPFLGLDLQGGVSVVLQPGPRSNVSADTLDEAINIINNRINSFGRERGAGVPPGQQHPGRDPGREGQGSGAGAGRPDGRAAVPPRAGWADPGWDARSVRTTTTAKGADHDHGQGRDHHDGQGGHDHHHGGLHARPPRRPSDRRRRARRSCTRPAHRRPARPHPRRPSRRPRRPRARPRRRSRAPRPRPVPPR